MVNYAAVLKTQFYVLTLKYYCSTLNKNVYILSSFVFLTYKYKKMERMGK